MNTYEVRILESTGPNTSRVTRKVLLPDTLIHQSMKTYLDDLVTASADGVQRTLVVTVNPQTRH
jgi:hypothetical protein